MAYHTDPCLHSLPGDSAFLKVYCIFGHRYESNVMRSGVFKDGLLRSSIVDEARIQLERAFGQTACVVLVVICCIPDILWTRYRSLILFFTSVLCARTRVQIVIKSSVPQNVWA